MDAVDQAALVAKGEVTPVELLEAAIERIERLDPALNAVVIAWFDHARRDRRRPDLPDGPVPRRAVPAQGPYTTSPARRCRNGNVALKEAAIVDTADTTLVARYQAAGLVIAGRTNSPEMGSLPTTQPTGVGPDAQPVGPRPHAGRVERRRGGGRGRRDGAVRQRLRRRREHPHPGVVLRAGRAQAEPGPDHRRPGARRGRPRRRALRQPHRARHGRAARRRARPRRRRHRHRRRARRPYVDEVGADPGRLRIGLLDVHPRASSLHDDCVDGGAGGGDDARGARPRRRAGVAGGARRRVADARSSWRCGRRSMAMAARRVRRRRSGGR